MCQSQPCHVFEYAHRISPCRSIPPGPQWLYCRAHFLANGLAQGLLRGQAEGSITLQAASHRRVGGVSLLEKSFSVHVSQQTFRSGSLSSTGRVSVDFPWGHLGAKFEVQELACCHRYKDSHTCCGFRAQNCGFHFLQTSVILISSQKIAWR